MNIMSTLKTRTLSEMTRIKEYLEGPQVSPLVSAIEGARRDWQMALREMDQIDLELSEYVIYKINAAERRYIALLKQAREEGITAWPGISETWPAAEVYPEGRDPENAPYCT